jgi:hypothetical protein
MDERTRVVTVRRVIIVSESDAILEEPFGSAGEKKARMREKEKAGRLPDPPF